MVRSKAKEAKRLKPTNPQVFRSFFLFVTGFGTLLNQKGFGEGPEDRLRPTAAMF